MAGLRELLADHADTGTAPDTIISGLATHSAKVRSGDLFLAMAGANGHGLSFFDDAVERGAAAVLWDGDFDVATLQSKVAQAPQAPQVPKAPPIPLIHCPDLRAKAGHIAARFYDHPSANMRLVAVTGTNGKTSVAHIVAQILRAKHGECGLFGTLGCGVLGALHDTAETTPDAPALHRELADQYQGGVRYAVLEASSHGLAQSRLAGVQVDVAVLTNLGRDHFDYHKTLQAYADSKKKLFEIEGLETAVLNIDSDFGVEVRALCDSRGVPTLTYSLKFDAPDKADVVGEMMEMSSAGIKMKVTFNDREVVVNSRLTGLFNASNLLAAFAVLAAMRYDADEVAKRLSAVEPVPGRMQMFTAAQRPMVLLDYAHTPDAMENVLLSARRMCDGKIICVFGCGGNRDKGKRFLMGEVASRLCDKSVLTDDNPRNESPQEIIAGIFAGMRDARSETVVTIHDRSRAIQYAIQNSTDKDCVLVLGKGHEETQDFGDRVEAFSDAEVINAMFADAGKVGGTGKWSAT